MTDVRGHAAQKEDPGALGPGSVRRMGEGLGGWGHATRRGGSTRQSVGGSWPVRIFFRPGFRAVVAGGTARCHPFHSRQGDRPPIRKLEITQVDTPATSLDDITRAVREPAGKIVIGADFGTHWALACELVPLTE